MTSSGKNCLNIRTMQVSTWTGPGVQNQWEHHTIVKKNFVRRDSLRLCKTAITWLRSLLAILPLFWRHDIAELHGLSAKTLEMYYDVIKYATYSRGLWLALCKTCSFHSILQQNLTFSLLTWLGSPIFFILFISTHNKLSMSGFK